MSEVTSVSLMVDGQLVIISDMTCYNCGEQIQMEEGFLYQFEPPEINYPHSPDTPEMHYLICDECAKEWLKLQENIRGL